MSNLTVMVLHKIDASSMNCISLDPYYEEWIQKRFPRPTTAIGEVVDYCFGWTGGAHKDLFFVTWKDCYVFYSCQNRFDVLPFYDHFRNTTNIWPND